MAGAAIKTPIHAHTGPMGLPIQTQRDPDTDPDGTARGTADVGNYDFALPVLGWFLSGVFYSRGE